MQLERDFITRMISQLARALARILLLKQKREIEQALDEMRGACKDVLGIPYDMLRMIDSASAASLLRHPSRISAYARLLCEEAELLSIAGDALSSDAARLRAFEIAIEAVLAGSVGDEPEKMVAALRGEVANLGVAEKYRRWLEV